MYVSQTSQTLADCFFKGRRRRMAEGEILVDERTVLYDHSGWPIAHKAKDSNHFYIWLCHTVGGNEIVPHGAIARLNALKGVKIKKKKGQLFLNGQPWDGINTKIML